jgi:hypothetical protein
MLYGHSNLVITSLTSKFVLLLNDKVCDGPAPVLHGPVPAEGHGLVVKVHNARLTRLAGRFCTGNSILKCNQEMALVKGQCQVHGARLAVLYRKLHFEM